MLNGIIFVNRDRLRWRDAPRDHGPHRHCVTDGSGGVFTRMMEGLSAQGAEPQTVTLDTTCLKPSTRLPALG